jgi:hypothetical protein
VSKPTASVTQTQITDARRADLRARTIALYNRDIVRCEVRAETNKRKLQSIVNQ